MILAEKQKLLHALSPSPFLLLFPPFLPPIQMFCFHFTRILWYYLLNYALKRFKIQTQKYI